jgi:hypothetical protein
MLWNVKSTMVIELSSNSTNVSGKCYSDSNMVSCQWEKHVLSESHGECTQTLDQNMPVYNLQWKMRQ